MKEEQWRRLLRRFAPRGYDLGSGAFRPWYRYPRFRVEVRAGRGPSHVWTGRIVIANGPRTSAHQLVHALHHEAAHCQLLPLDLALLGAAAPTLAAAGVGPFLLGLLAWQFLWRELAADALVATRLGLANTWRGYARERRGAQGQGGVEAGR